MSVTLTSFYFFVRRMTKRMWFRASVYALLGVATAFVALLGKDLLPAGEFTKIGANAVVNILSILASSMLAVATFSLSIMVTAFTNVSNGATPRASRLLVENQSAQRAVATFIGAFLYSIVALIALTTASYGDEGRFLLFLVTVAVIIVIVATLIRWVDQLSTLGRVGETILQIERAARTEIKKVAREPRFGANELAGDFPKMFPLRAEKVGYVSFIDFAAIDGLADEQKFLVYFDLIPGSFAYPLRPLCYFDRAIDQTLKDRISSHIIIEETRTFEQDPRFGFILLSEIASRALSPAVNDPGTAIEAMNSTVRLLDFWSRESRGPSPCRYRNIHAIDISFDEIIEDVFGRLARDGATLVEIAIKIQKSLASLAELDAPKFARGARREAVEALEIANVSLRRDVEKKVVAEVWTARV